MGLATILVVEDEPGLRDALCDTLGMAGYPVAGVRGGREALELMSAQDVGMVISDVRMEPMDGCTLLDRVRSVHPQVPVLLMTAYGTVRQAVEAMQKGAVDYLVKPFEADLLVDTVGRYVAPGTAEDQAMVAVDERTRQTQVLAQRVALTDATVMITGESGVGKEVLARYIHRESRRADRPFVAINCAAIPENMLEATLFGYEKGAFTGAYQACPGKFEQAQGGTLLLDEVSELDLGLQAKLLRVLQEREVERLGGRKMIALDVRVLATSNRDLRAEVKAGMFREDLFYRLNVFPLHLASLRERTDDILPLARRMLAAGARRQQRAVPELTAAAEERLLAHPWPGNVRELDNVIQRALILQAAATVTADDLQLEQGAASAAVVADGRGAAEEAGLSSDLKSREQSVILETLKAVNGSRSAAAERLGISPRTLRYKLARIRAAGASVPRAYGAESA